MPRKKLTKAQVKRKIKTASNVVYDLLLDKMGHGGASFVPMSLVKMLDLQKIFDRARTGLK
jgi:hypothetical protein